MMATAGDESNPVSREAVRDHLEPLRKRLEEFKHKYAISRGTDKTKRETDKEKRLRRMIKSLSEEICKIEKKPNLRVDPYWEKRFPFNTHKPPAGREDRVDAIDGGRQASSVNSRSSNRGQSGTTVVDSTGATEGKSLVTTRLHYIFKAVDDPYLHIKRARVLIIINVAFDRIKPRLEAREDYLKLKNVFIDKLGYEDFFFEALQDKTKYGIAQDFAAVEAEHLSEYSWKENQMLAIIKAFAITPRKTNANDSDCDALMLFIGSHGSCIDGTDAVAGTDYLNSRAGRILLNEIIQILDECDASIKNIPKFVFVQACRGDKPIPQTELMVIDGAIQMPQTQGIIHDPLPSSVEKLTLEETAGTPDSEVAPPALSQVPPDNQGDRGALANQGSRTRIQQNLPVATLDTDTNQARGDGAGMNVPEQTFQGIPIATGDASVAARSLAPTERNVSLPSIPNNFLVAYSAPKGCWSGRIPLDNHDPIIHEGSIFTQILAMHLEECLAQVGDSRSGVALLPLLTGVQNDVSMHWLEIGVLEHRLSKLPVLGINWENFHTASSKNT